MQNISSGGYTFTLTGGEEDFNVSLSLKQSATGIIRLNMKLQSDEPRTPGTMELTWKLPVIDVFASWHPGFYRNKRLRVDWENGFRSKATSSAPVCVLYGFQGNNKMTFAFSDALNPVELKAGIHEETSNFLCSVKLFQDQSSPIQSYEATLHIDTRDIPYEESLADVQRWWSTMPGYEPSPVPDTAKLPMYATWYSFHQQLSAEAVERQCEMAKALGCEAVIVDDGWQTADNARGYAYCGDWDVFEGKIHDMRAHVDRVHEIGMKFLLWYSVPFVGKHSNVWPMFENKLLGKIEDLGAGVLDPRFPDVREYIIGTYENALRDWDLDGFKLDFVDSFNLTLASDIEGRDYESVPEAVDRLLSDVMSRLRAIKPDIMIEFRQSYIGPLMRKYGNMFRALDCPNDALENRSRTLDVRLLAGDTAVHADPLMWNPEEPTENAALQLVNTLFAVPQVSVLLDQLPESHLRMLRFWLSFWREKREVLLDGRLTAKHPELVYPLVTASDDNEAITAVYADIVANPGSRIPKTWFVVNGTLNDRIVIELEESMGERNVVIRDCQGQVTATYKSVFAMGLHPIAIPPAGIAVFEA
ncbi:glycoside hydrolase family 36 protein [Paenibacillus sp. FSL K6-0276]|uniref:glycoside hydrolase family 36 protein n=2 Tax=unclassified Paenibacillus TaxID=185978 RepID=UPI0030EB2269